MKAIHKTNKENYSAEAAGSDQQFSNTRRASAFSNFITILRHGLKKKQEFLGLYSFLRTLFPWRSSTFSGEINKSRRIRFAGIMSTFAFVLLSASVFAPLYVDRNYSEALTGAAKLSETTLTLTTSDINLAISNISPDGSFNASNNSNNISVKTDNYTGYTLTLSPTGSGTSATQLVSGSNVFNTISSAVTPANFSASTTAGKAYNNLWGILPSKLNSTANSNYQPAPTSSMTIDSTSAANSTANNYSLNIGARADYTNPTGTYTGTFNIVATAKAPRYTITYDKNTTDSVSSLPSSQQSTSSSLNYVTLSSNTPTRTGYTFNGWCDGSFRTAANGTNTCSGTSYAKGTTFYLDQTTSNSTTLYAMWTRRSSTYYLYFNKDTTDTVTNFPSTRSGSNSNGSYSFSFYTSTSYIPVRDGYNFLGWAESSGQATPTYAWNGTSYSPSSVTLAQTSMSTYSYSKTLYAVWEKAGVTIDNVHYMQDFAISNASLIESMTPNRQYQLIDSRDNKTYYVAKVQTSCSNPRVTAESDGNCYQVWMTQNLDLSLVTAPNFYTHNNTDLGWSSNNFDETKKWTAPSATTTSIYDMYGNTYAYFGSYNPGDIYYYTNNSASTSSNIDSAGGYKTTACGLVSGMSEAECMAHYHAGNYYSWNAAVANNLSSTQYDVRPDSICPAGWKLPVGITASNGYSDFNYLFIRQNVAINLVGQDGNAVWSSSGINKIRTTPLFFIRSGYAYLGALYDPGNFGLYWSSSVGSAERAYSLTFTPSVVGPAFSVNYGYKYYGLSVRCLARELDNLYTISYDANGGIGNTPYQSVAYSGTTTLNGSYFIKSGYIFTGWNTKANGSGTSYAAGASFTAPASGDGITFYAQWISIDTFPKMQNLTLTDCTTTNQVVVDSRDNRTYTVKKIGNYCVMTQNLRYTGGSNGTVTTGSAIAANGTAYSMTSSTAANYQEPYYFDSGREDYGVYYNYCAATGKQVCTNSNTTGITPATNSICPAGWKLPTSLTSTSWGGISTTDIKTSGDFAVYAGVYNNGSASNIESYGYWWSATAYSGDTYRRYFLNLGASDYINAQVMSYRTSLLSVRCMLSS